MSDELQGLLRGWELSLWARNLSAATIAKYLESARQLVAWLVEHDVTTAAAIERRHVERFITGMPARLAEDRVLAARIAAAERWGHGRPCRKVTASPA